MKNIDVKGNEIWISDKYAEIIEHKDAKEPNEDGIRVYRTMVPDVFNIQTGHISRLRGTPANAAI